MSIERTYVVLPGVRGDRPTKTRSAWTVTLDPDSVQALAAGWRRAVSLSGLFDVSADRRREGHVFSNDPVGARGWRPDVVNARWARTRTAAGVETSVRLHDLRHWQATQLLDAGVPIPTVAARLGHADGTTTMKVYAHRTKRSDGLPASVVGDALAKRPPRPTDTARLE